MKSICIAGTQSGCGKTTVTMAILGALSKKMSVQPFKVGPDYIDPMFHSYITGKKCRNLDSYLMEPVHIKYLFEHNMKDADIGVIEGVMGLFDGADVGSDIGTTASIAKLTKTPVILVVDGSKVAASIAATVQGFQNFDPKLSIAGVICNKVGGEGHYQLLKEAIEYYCDIEVLGYLSKEAKINLPERHLGLVPTDELENLEARFEHLADIASQTIDLERLIQLAKGQVIHTPHAKKKKMPKLRIAYAKDEAFHFYYEDNLDFFREQGVELISFSPIHDQELPKDIHGLIIGGGFPEIFAGKLAKNSQMKRSLRMVLQSGLPYYAECGGLMYLCEKLYDLEGKEHSMVGWFQGETSMQSTLQNFGYATLTLTRDCIFGEAGDSIAVHEFHRSKARIQEEKIYALHKEKKGAITRQWSCGYGKGNGVASYAHMHFYANLDFAEAFIKSCLQYKEKVL